MRDNKRGSARQRKRIKKDTRMERTIRAAVQGSALCGNRGECGSAEGNNEENNNRDEIR